MPALLWLPAGMLAVEVLRTGSAEQVVTPSSLMELPAAVPFGLPLALACRRLGRLGYPGPALLAWVSLGAVSVAGFFVPLPLGVQGAPGLSSGLAGGLGGGPAARDSPRRHGGRGAGGLAGRSGDARHPPLPGRVRPPAVGWPAARAGALTREPR